MDPVIQPTQEFEVDPELADKTVLAALRHWIPGTSWSAARKLLTGRHIAINGTLCLDESRRVAIGDAVHLHSVAMATPPRETDVVIRYLDRDVVVVEKPAGMITQRHVKEQNWRNRRKQLQPSLEESVARLIAMRDRHGGWRRQKRQPPFGHPHFLWSVHRLDRETSGLLVFARNERAAQYLIEQFSQHTVERLYRAVAFGQVSSQTIRSRLVYDRGDGKRGSTTAPDVGKPAITHVRFLEQLGPCSLIECRLETGRTHQIRIHLSEAGHPVCGDGKYPGDAASPEPVSSASPRVDSPEINTPASDRSTTNSELPTGVRPPRLALHAAILGFHHPADQQRMQFEMADPTELADFIEQLRPSH